MVVGYSRVHPDKRSEPHVVVVSANQVRSARDEYQWGAEDSQRRSGLALPSPQHQAADVATAVDIVNRLILVQDVYVMAIRGDAIQRTAGGPEDYEGHIPHNTYLTGRQIRRIWQYLRDKKWVVRGPRVHRVGLQGGIPGLGTRQAAEWALEGSCPHGVRPFEYILSGVPKAAQ